MSTLTKPTLDAQPSTGLTGQPVSTRVLSLDIFRGFAMAVMIFVNDLGEVKGLSRWTYHIPRDINAMSYVDMVYPFFLFAVGLALPLAIRQRLRRDPSLLHLWGHILLRVLALLVLGLILANAGNTSHTLTHMRGSLWALGSLLGAILLWAVYPPATPPRLIPILRGLGVLLLITMLALFRRRLPTGGAAWLDFSYPEILGLIGLTYLGVCLLYIPTRRFAWAPLAWFAALVLLNIGILAHRLPYPQPMYLFPWDNGAMPSITMASVVISGIFLPDSTPVRSTEATPLPPAEATPVRPAQATPDRPAEATPDRSTNRSPVHPSATPSANPRRGFSPNPQAAPQRKLLLALTFAVTCALLGLLLRPLGISKIRATPTWALWSIAVATAIFALFYWLLDLRHTTRWAFLLRAPGANTLLTYLLPDLTYFALAALGLSHIFARWSYGTPGVARALCFTLVMLLLSWLITRARLRLQL